MSVGEIVRGSAPYWPPRHGAVEEEPPACPNRPSLHGYQREVDAAAMETARIYGERFQALVRTRRVDMGQPQLPFYYAQLSRYVVDKGYEGWDTVREAQRAAEAAIQPGGMVGGDDRPESDRSDSS